MRLGEGEPEVESRLRTRVDCGRRVLACRACHYYETQSFSLTWTFTDFFFESGIQRWVLANLIKCRLAKDVWNCVT